MEWLLEKGGRALYYWTEKKVRENKEKKADEKNKKAHKDDIDSNASPEQKGRSGRRLLNNEK